MAQILPALLTAILQTNSPSRVIITSRYRFPAPAGTSIQVESLETLTAVEQDKKVANLANLRPGSDIASAVRDRSHRCRRRQPPPTRLGSTGSSPTTTSTWQLSSPPSRTRQTAS
jgi:hypothetical protein